MHVTPRSSLKRISCLFIVGLIKLQIACSFLIANHLQSGHDVKITTIRRYDSPERANTVEKVKTAIPRNILGPPELLRSLKIGEHLNAFRRGRDDTNMDFKIERVAYGPDVFVLRNFLTESECSEIQSIAKRSNMGEAETVTQDDFSSRKNCNVAWINSTETSLVNNLVSATANLLLSKEVLSHPSAGVEDLQVLEYKTGGEYVLHHDGEPRVLTVIYYINGVGGTWFPLARTSNNENNDPCFQRNIDEDAMEERFMNARKQPMNKEQALDLGGGSNPGEDGGGLLVKGVGNTKSQENENIAWISKGDAVAFYNYLDDGSGRLNWRAIHGGLPTEEKDGSKWIANHWFRVNQLDTQNRN